MKHLDNLLTLSTAFESRLQELRLEISSIQKELAKYATASPEYPFAREDVFYLEAKVKVPANRIQDLNKVCFVNAFCYYTENKCYFSVDANQLPWKDPKYTQSYLTFRSQDKMIFQKFEDDRGIMAACRTLALPDSEDLRWPKLYTTSTT